MSTWKNIKEMGDKFKTDLIHAIAQAVSSHCGDAGSITEAVMWNLWWTKRHSGMFSSSISVSPA
jgi:hypothetical protein